MPYDSLRGASFSYGSFRCGRAGDGLKVNYLSYDPENGARIRIGMNSAQAFYVNARSASVLSGFFAELATQLEAKKQATTEEIR